MGDHKRIRGAARILWGHCRRTAAAADAQALSARVRTARAGGGATEKARVTLTSAREWPLGEDAVRGEAVSSSSYLISGHQGRAGWIDRAL